MPTPTPDEIRAAAAQNAAEGIASAEVDGRTATALDPLKQIEAAQKLESQQLLTGATGRRPASGWAGRGARAELPGAN